MDNEEIQPQEPIDPMKDKLQTFFAGVQNLQENYSNFKRTINKPIVFITSGGTSVPLEANTVRSVENFSTGTRGSRSAEYFLKAGHPVIFFYRQESIQPFSIEIQSKRDDWMKSYSMNGDNNQFNTWVKDYQKYHNPQSPSSKLLIKIPFVSIHDYLDGIEKISRSLSENQLSSISYMAAAVSDFWIPLDQMEQHKIQSKDVGDEGYKLIMENTPRMLGHVKHTWNPNTILISFKLETDMEILEQKAIGAMEKYKVDMVVANQLQTRRTQVCIYQSDGTHQQLEVPEPHFQQDQISQIIVEHIQQKLGIYDEPEEIIVEDSQMKVDTGGQNKGNEMKNELYITNIDFKSHQEDLKKHFEQIGQVTKCKIIYQGGRSKGKAFVEYLDSETAQNAINQLNGQTFEGRELNVEIQGLYDFVVKKPQSNYHDRNERRGYEPRESRERYSKRHDYNDRENRDRRPNDRHDRNGLRSRSDKEARYHKETSKTLYIGNLSYDTNEENIEKVFEGYGKVEDVRISYNHGGSSKGFAYVEFQQERDAVKAHNENHIEIDGREVRLDYDTKGTRGGYSKFHHRGQEPDHRNRDSSPRYNNRRNDRDSSYDRPGIYRGGEEYEKRYR